MELDVTALCGFTNDMNNLVLTSTQMFGFTQVHCEGIHWAEGDVSMEGWEVEGFYWPSLP